MGNTHPPLWFEPYPDGFSECPQWAPKERASAGGQDQVVENGLHNTDGPVSSTSDRVLSSNDVFHDMPITEPFLDHPIAAYMNDESKYRVGNIPSRFGRNVLNPELRVENPEQHMVNGQDYNQYYSSTWPKQPSQWNPDLHFPYNDNVEGIIGSSSRVNNSINNSQGNLMDRYLGSMLQSPFQYDDCFRYPNERTFPSAEYPDDLLADTDPHSRKWTSQMLLAYDSSARFGVDNAVISSNLHQQYQQGQLAPGNLNEVISTNREGLWNELSTLSDLPVLVPAGADVLLQSPTFTCLTAQNGDIKPHLQSSEKVANSVVDVMRLESQVLRQALKNTLTSSWASVQPISDETPNESSQKLEAEAACLAACLRCRIRKKAMCCKESSASTKPSAPTNASGSIKSAHDLRYQ
ncbi:MAG: hypothetical protein M1827_005589 [Pycnora praestabilis]|nr:MAG: hypothetical protein M1827_005589 [Pycnora praestabilis]